MAAAPICAILPTRAGTGKTRCSGQPTNPDIYLSGSSLLSPLLGCAQKEAKWALLHRHTDLTLAGRLDFPPGQAPILFLPAEEGIRPRATQQPELDSIADYVAGIATELRQRGQQLMFVPAPEKSYVYSERLPAGMTAGNNFIPGLTQALRQRGVYAVDLSLGLRQAALADAYPPLLLHRRHPLESPGHGRRLAHRG